MHTNRLGGSDGFLHMEFHFQIVLLRFETQKAFPSLNPDCFHSHLKWDRGNLNWVFQKFLSYHNVWGLARVPFDFEMVTLHYKNFQVLVGPVQLFQKYKLQCYMSFREMLIRSVSQENIDLVPPQICPRIMLCYSCTGYLVEGP